MGLYHWPRESAEGWKQVVQDLKQRGLQQTGLVLCDELSGIESALEQHVPHRAIQCCLVHKVRRLIAHVRHQDKARLIANWHEVLDLDNPFHTPAQFQLCLTKCIDQRGKRYASIRGHYLYTNGVITTNTETILCNCAVCYIPLTGLSALTRRSEKPRNMSIASPI